jgi:hypothetical protein
MFALSEIEICDGQPDFKQDVEPTVEEERNFAKYWIGVSKDGVVTGADEATKIIQRTRKLYADVQTLINLVEKVIKKTGSRIDWAFDPNGHEDPNHYCDDDPSILPAN